MRIIAILLSAAVYASITQAQPPTMFSSGSTGADGPLTYAPNLGMVYFPPAGLAQRANNVYNFTTITIGTGTTVRLSGWIINGPVYWLAQSDVTISGTVDLTGQIGNQSNLLAQPGQRAPTEPGAGGYSGGLGAGAVSGQNATAGSGPGGGLPAGSNPANLAVGGNGAFSGNTYLQPLIGGSGGGGGCGSVTGENCFDGGAGGGAILIASTTQITISQTGSIFAQGGGSINGGGGSGGAIRLVSNTITFSHCGGLNAGGAAGGISGGGSGIIRLESFNSSNVGQPLNECANGTVYTFNPVSLGLPTGGASTVSVTSINNMAINANPFKFPDTTINTASPVPVIISGVNVPPGTTGNLYIFGESTPDQTIPFTLAGTLQSTTATVNVTYPSVGSRGFAKVTWTGR
jgi:hypothetical protein